MMNLYEINNEILSLVDEETGEILDFERFEQLNMEKEQKTENIALWIKNLNADSDMLKKEIDNLNDRKKQAERKEEQLRKYLSYMLDGQSFKTPKVACSFRKSTSAQVDDEQSFVNWAMENRKDLLSFKQPTISKTEIKNCLKAGEIIEGAHLVENNNLQIK